MADFSASFDSARQCEGATGIPRAVLMAAKAGGCPAFVHSRIDLVAFLRWYFDPARGDETGHRLDLNQEKAALAVAQRQKIEFENLASNEAWIQMLEAEKLLGDVIFPLRQQLDTLPTTMNVRCNPMDPELARRELMLWIDDIKKLLRDKLPRNGEAK